MGGHASFIPLLERSLPMFYYVFLPDMAQYRLRLTSASDQEGLQQVTSPINSLVACFSKLAEAETCAQLYSKNRKYVASPYVTIVPPPPTSYHLLEGAEKPTPYPPPGSFIDPPDSSPCPPSTPASWDDSPALPTCMQQYRIIHVIESIPSPMPDTPPTERIILGPRWMAFPAILTEDQVRNAVLKECLSFSFPPVAGGDLTHLTVYASKREPLTPL